MFFFKINTTWFEHPNFVTIYTPSGLVNEVVLDKV
jgi:hypothetical protein